MLYYVCIFSAFCIYFVNRDFTDKYVAQLSLQENDEMLFCDKRNSISSTVEIEI